MPTNVMRVIGPLQFLKNHHRKRQGLLAIASSFNTPINECSIFVKELPDHLAQWHMVPYAQQY
eukprot:11472647-Ditylum_brightwellii.AAC.1